MRIGPDASVLPEVDFGAKSFSNVNFAQNGNVYLGEHLVGHEVKLPPDRPLGTKLPFMPGTERFGDGHVFEFTPAGELVQEFATETHGGMPGFLGVTSATLAADGKTLVYMSELGNRLFRYDVAAGKQLPDLITYEPASGDMAMTAAYQGDGTLLYIKANFKEGFFLQSLDESGEATQTWNTQGPGWAALGCSKEPGMALLGNFFTGTVAKMDLASGEIVAKAETEVKRALAGIAQY